MDRVIVCLTEALPLEDAELSVTLGSHHGTSIGLSVSAFDESDREELCDVVVGGCILRKARALRFDLVYCVVSTLGFLLDGSLSGYSSESGVNGRGRAGCLPVMMGDHGGDPGCCVLCGSRA